jgi:hypothetical protein
MSSAPIGSAADCMTWRRLPDPSKEIASLLRRSRRARFYADEDIEDEVVERSGSRALTSRARASYRSIVGRPTSFTAPTRNARSGFSSPQTHTASANDRAAEVSTGVPETHRDVSGVALSARFLT